MAFFPQLKWTGFRGKITPHLTPHLDAEGDPTLPTITRTPHTRPIHPCLSRPLFHHLGTLRHTNQTPPPRRNNQIPKSTTTSLTPPLNPMDLCQPNAPTSRPIPTSTTPRTTLVLDQVLQLGYPRPTNIEPDPSLKAWARITRHIRTLPSSGAHRLTAVPIHAQRTQSGNWILDNLQPLRAAQYLAATNTAQPSCTRGCRLALVAW